MHAAKIEDEFLQRLSAEGFTRGGGYWRSAPSPWILYGFQEGCQAQPNAEPLRKEKNLSLHPKKIHVYAQDSLGQRNRNCKLFETKKNFNIPRQRAMNGALLKLVRICHSVGDKWRLISSIYLMESHLLKIYPATISSPRDGQRNVNNNHCKLRFISSTRQTFQQLEHAVMYMYTL